LQFFVVVSLALYYMQTFFYTGTILIRKRYKHFFEYYPKECRPYS
jgi:hypothetical protein